MAEPARKRQRRNFTDPLCVYVGAEKKQYTVHEAEITKTSRFFASATNGKWEEVTKNGIVLPDHEPITFEIYAEWLYSGDIVLDHDPPQTLQQSGIVLQQLMELYVLGQFLLDCSFKNAVVDKALEIIDSNSDCDLCPSVEILTYLWSNVPPVCLMKDLIAGEWARTVEEGDIAAYGKGLSIDIFIDLARHLNSFGDDDVGPNFENRRTYHEHEDKAPQQWVPLFVHQRVHV